VIRGLAALLLVVGAISPAAVQQRIPIEERFADVNGTSSATFREMVAVNCRRLCCRPYSAL
jgi:hypothetical protein